MALNTERCGALVLRLIVGLALLGWPRMGSAQGTWSVISLPQQPGEVKSPTALAVDTASNLYVAAGGRIQKRDPQGNWSVIATDGWEPGQVGAPMALAVDATGNLYVAAGGRIQKRDAQGNWSVIATGGTALGQVSPAPPAPLAVDAAGNLYVADSFYDSAAGKWVHRVQKRDAQGNWSVIADHAASALAADTAGNLYVAGDRIQKRDAQILWSVSSVC